ncbi:MAG: hypothetical protein U5S82_12565 [Gammaproteobacteria bacterium]|nr:hypothetical protein [Gammaproteobacteria bacterium]
MQIKATNRARRLFVATFVVVLLGACSNGGDGTPETVAGTGQCWSEPGGVGNLLKNSSTKKECKALGGKSWCPVGGGCENL